MLTRLVYISTTRQPVTDAECRAILEVSRRNNLAAGITGLLVVGGNRFLQLLEGPTEAVEERFDVIHRDPRHFAVVQLDRREVEARQCPDWAMGYVQGGPYRDGQALEDIVAALVAPMEDKYLQAQFTGFAAIRRRAA